MGNIHGDCVSDGAAVLVVGAYSTQDATSRRRRGAAYGVFDETRLCVSVLPDLDTECGLVLVAQQTLPLPRVRKAEI